MKAGACGGESHSVEDKGIFKVRGVVLDSASRREAKRGQSTNRKGEMRSRFSSIG